MKFYSANGILYYEDEQGYTWKYENGWKYIGRN